MTDKRLRRRAFLGIGVSAAVGGTAAACRRGANRPWRFFTAAEAQTVDAICGQLIPADRDPGAKEAGVVHYIDLQLSRRFRRYQAAYHRGLDATDAASRSRYGRPFAELSSSRQIDILSALESNEKEFFDLILLHTRQGFYGDPRHGGNRDMVSWKMLGLAFPPVRGRMHYDETKAV